MCGPGCPFARTSWAKGPRAFAEKASAWSRGPSSLRKESRAERAEREDEKQRTKHCAGRWPPATHIAISAVVGAAMETANEIA